MESQLIISVGREFGSAGHEIAQRLAEHYNIPLLDSNLLNEVASEKNLDIQKLQGLDEKHKKYGLYRTVRGFSSHPEDNVAFMQFDYLRKKASRGESFVVVGRCSEDILKEYKSLISIFILGDIECKKARIKELKKKILSVNATTTVIAKVNGVIQEIMTFPLTVVNPVWIIH